MIELEVLDILILAWPEFAFQEVCGTTIIRPLESTVTIVVAADWEHHNRSHSTLRLVRMTHQYLLYPSNAQPLHINRVWTASHVNGRRVQGSVFVRIPSNAGWPRRMLLLGSMSAKLGSGHKNTITGKEERRVSSLGSESTLNKESREHKETAQ